MWEWAVAIIGFSAGLAFLFAMGDLLRSPRTNQTYVQVSLFLVAGIFQSHTYLVFSGGYLNYPHFYLVHLPVTALFGPLLKRYFSSLWEEKPVSNKFSVGEILPSILVLLLLSKFYLSSSEEKLRVLSAYPKAGVPILFKIVIFIAVFPVLYSGIYVFRQMVLFTRWESIKRSAHLRLVVMVVGIGMLASLLGLFTLFFHREHGLEIVSLLISLLIIAVYLLRQKNPELWGEVQKILIEEKKYQSTQLRSFDISKLTEKLDHLMKKEKVYQDESINLVKLSKQMDLTEHQLSEFLNLHIRKSFFHLINHYRILEAKELCKSHPEKNILTIAYEVGFPSKSTFYDAFKREVGTSPTEYRKKLK